MSNDAFRNELYDLVDRPLRVSDPVQLGFNVGAGLGCHLARADGSDDALIDWIAFRKPSARLGQYAFEGRLRRDNV